MSITAKTAVEQHIGQDVPVDPYKFGTDIQFSQSSSRTFNGRHRILFNKGRYFETTIGNPQLLEALCNLTGFKPKHHNTIVQSWKDMEDFVIAMNILGYYVDINIDWI